MLRDEKGQVLVITAVSMVCLMGFLALAVDVGVLFSTRRRLQIVADAGATAAALNYLNNGHSTSAAITAGTTAATNNGGTAAVTVNANSASPAAHKVCSGSTCYFEAIASQQDPLVFFNYFFALFQGQSASAFTVQARAVAGTPAPSKNCMYLTNPTGTALTVQGNWSINAPNCGVYINSNSSSVEDDTGHAAHSGISAVSVSIVGSLPNDVTTSAPVLHTLPQAIPFSSVPDPTIPSTCPAGGTLSGTVPAGCYSGTVTIGSATLNGLYIFTGDVTINGALTGTNVTLDIASGSLTIKPGNSTLNLSAPTSGTYNGIVIYQPLANTSTLKMQAGSSTGNLTGFLYAPGATLSMQDHGGSLTVGGLVVSTIDNGPAVLNISGYGASTSPLKTVSLVE